MRSLSAKRIKVKILFLRVHLLCMMLGSLFSYRLLHVSVLSCIRYSTTQHRYTFQCLYCITAMITHGNTCYFILSYLITKQALLSKKPVPLHTLLTPAIKHRQLRSEFWSTFCSHS